MSTDRDVARIVRSWLEEGVTALPDRVLDGVLDRLPATPQRRVLWPARRFQTMSTTLRLALTGVAAVLVVGLVGFAFWPRTGGVAGPLPSVAPSASLQPTPTPSPIALPASGALEPGTYRIDNFLYTGSKSLTLTVPAGWTTAEGFVSKAKGQAGEVELSTWVARFVHADSCHHTARTLVDVGTSPDTLVSTLTTLRNRVVSRTTDVTVGGFPAKRLELSVPADLDVSTCANGAIKNWADGANDTGGLCCGGPGFVDVVYVVDIKGRSLAVVARRMPGSTAQDLAELQAIVDSIRIVP